MLKLGAREADGVIINWLSAQDVTKVAKVVSDAANGVEKEITARIFVCPSEDTEVVRAGALDGTSPVDAGNVGYVESRRPQSSVGGYSRSSSG
jgi:alkanesulfonate monooxygenase SsuD/methylene tetrahydromethanopterin reductase-like flavin-dependent oxidoreductase (luciferase family)